MLQRFDHLRLCFRLQRAMRRGAVIALIGISLDVSAIHAQSSLETLKDFRIDGLVRFNDVGGAEAARERLIRAIWPEGLPASRPQVTTIATDAVEIASIERSLFASAKRFDINVSGFDWHANVFVVYPGSAERHRSRLAIVQGGHMPEGVENYLTAGLSDAANQLLKDGYVVALVQMPLVGWNHDADGVIGDTAFAIRHRSTGGHDELFARVEPILKAGTMRFFIEPVVQTINELIAEYPDHETVLMIGLSGGGWTTHLAAAVETRIDMSIPVAGALPLYARPFSPGSKGDAEQEYSEIFAEQDSDGDGIPDRATGIASWLEVFALGGISPDADRVRRQIQVLNLYDSCCFSGEVYKTYAEPLSKLTAQISSGSWSITIDDTHRGHLISPEIIKNVLAVRPNQR